MKHAKYDIIKVDKFRKIVFIADMGSGPTKSVTNDAEYVYGGVQILYPGHRVVYRDSCGNWDEIGMKDGNAEFLVFEGELPIDCHIAFGD